MGVVRRICGVSKVRRCSGTRGLVGGQEPLIKIFAALCINLGNRVRRTARSTSRTSDTTSSERSNELVRAINYPS
jgi:hypothetical protein